jgi:predicted transcriptional regulator
MAQGENEQTITKHEQIIRYIEALKMGSKISVRQIAKGLEVSEGTAYRAIKDRGWRDLRGSRRVVEAPE